MGRTTRPGRIAALAALLLATSVEGGEDADGRAMVREARKAVDAYHAGAARSGGVLRVVYFVPADAEPLRDHVERIGRVVEDVDAFFRDGLRRFGRTWEGLPLERKSGKLTLHTVRGKRPADQYHYSSGDATAAEVREALRGAFDLDREHVLVFYALCRKGDDGRYVFDAPYYGGGDRRGGLCHAADCELLGPRRLRETATKVVYTEHYYPRVEESVAEFNSKYLGGVAHELGHALGLPHDDGGPAERGFGVSLMGRGNLSYRRDAWNGGPAAYLSLASALRLVSHPLVTGSDRGRWEEAGGRFESLRVAPGPGGVRVEASLVGAVPPYAAVAYVWPTRDATDHGARTYPALVNEGGAFAIDLDGLRPGAYHLRLVGLHANGAETSLGLTLTVSEADPGDRLVRRAEEALMARSPDARALLDDRALAAAPTPEARRKLRLLRDVLEPRAPLDLAGVAGDRASLGDAAWAEARVGWGRVARNAFGFDDRFRVGAFLQLCGRVYDKGLYAHSPSLYAFDLGGKWTMFRGAVGLRDGADARGSAVFSVVGDGRELRRSRVLHAGEREDLAADISGVRRLELRAEGGEGHTTIPGRSGSTRR